MKSRRIFKIILITAVLVIILSIPAFATAKNGVVKSQANVRSGPGRSYSLVYKDLPANTQIIIIDRVKCNDGTTSKDWYKVEFNYGGKFYENCYISTGLVTVTSDSGISDEVPELYKSYIDNLKKAHSNWNFKFLYTGLSWDEVLENENVSGRSALQVPPYDKKYLSTTDKTYNPSTGTWTPIDGKTWFQASSDVVSYYLDPRNFLTKESDIFQFETLSYDKNAQTLSGVESMLKGTFMEKSKISTGEKENVGGSCDLNSYNKTDIGDAMMLFQYSAGNLADLGSGKDIADLNGDGEIDVADAMILFQYVGGSRKTIGNNAETDVTVTYAQAFMNAAESYDVSPYHLVSRVIQEVGSNGSRSVSGKEPGYEGIYNYYNIGAYQSSDPVINALKWASTPSSNEKYLRPWNSRYKAILGGAKYIATGYISVGQNTLYLQKFDVVANGGLYSHQYMSNIMAASSEGIRTYNKYSNMGQLSNSFTFLIPVYDNMPNLPAGVKPTR